MTRQEIESRLEELNLIFRDFYENHFGDEEAWKAIDGDEIAEEEERLSDMLINEEYEED